MPRLQAALQTASHIRPVSGCWNKSSRTASPIGPSRTPLGFDHREKPLQAASQAAPQEQTEFRTEAASNPRGWLLSQELDRRGEDSSRTWPDTAEELRQRYLDATGGSSSWSDRQWLFERDLAIRTADRIASEQPAPDPVDAGDVIGHFDRWREGAVSFPAENSSDKNVYEIAADEQLAGLCLAAGGIRSATFCLGILQTLAARDLLKNFDYISSVSGGG